MDYVMMSRGKISQLLDVTVLRGEGRGMSDHFLVEGKLKVGMKWSKVRQRGEERKVLKVRELGKEKKAVEFQEMLSKDWSEVKGQEVGDVG